MRSEIYGELTACLDRREGVVLATVVEGRGAGSQMLIWPRGETFGDLGSPRLNQRAALFAEQIFPERQSGRKSFRWDEDDLDVFFEVIPPPAELIIVGAVHVAISLVRLAGGLGYRTVVIDPRTAFATAERFAAADALIARWPEEAFQDIQLHEGSSLVVLSHDMKIDLPALAIGLGSPCSYLGALGSRRTHTKRVEALLEKGFSSAEIDRIHAPVGLALGGRTAEEIALAIMAQIVAVSHGRPTRLASAE
jgi:xanthine dehydrogenase accessory factor